METLFERYKKFIDEVPVGELIHSDKKMSNFLYAIFMTKATLQSYHHLGLEKYTRKQNSGNMVNVVIGIKEAMVDKFEELANVKLQSSDDFQGKMKLA